ncbi:MAG: sugar kinase [Treponema sp.]|nr:sugar kinase [Treponema sp.]
MGKVVLFGELMLRLKPEGKNRFFQNPCFEAVFGGSEANVAVSLSKLGKPVRYITSLPDNAIGEAAESSLRYYGVEVSALKKDGRLGIYFLETGACQRPSKVIYDREGSCFYLSEPDEYDWKNAFSDAEWFHVSGVSPAVSAPACRSVMRAMEEAKKSGAVISLDLNYRKKLWKYGKSAPEVMTQLAGKADVLIANEEDIQNCLGIPLGNFSTPAESYKNLCESVKKAFPNVRIVAVTLRRSYSADRNGWGAVLHGQTGFYESALYDIENIVERVGAGDSFAAGLIFALTTDENKEKKESHALEFAAAASCLKHSINGDFNLATKSEVELLMKGNGTGRIQR